MKKLSLHLVALACLVLLASAKPSRDCKCKNILLYGRVKVVEHHADFRVRIVEHHADLHVKKVQYRPKSCGEWQPVDSHPDFTVQLVNSHEDFSIRYVDHHQGLQF